MEFIAALLILAGLLGHLPVLVGLIKPGWIRLHDSGGMECGGKRFCKDMSSCTEACFYLNQCNVRRLDADDDGRPCEKLCSRACN